MIDVFGIKEILKLGRLVMVLFRLHMAYVQLKVNKTAVISCIYLETTITTAHETSPSDAFSKSVFSIR